MQLKPHLKHLHGVSCAFFVDRSGRSATKSTIILTVITSENKCGNARVDRQHFVRSECFTIVATPRPISSGRVKNHKMWEQQKTQISEPSAWEI